MIATHKLDLQPALDLDAEGTTWRVNCPNCTRSFIVRLGMLPETVRCPTCQTKYLVRSEDLPVKEAK